MGKCREARGEKLSSVRVHSPASLTWKERKREKDNLNDQSLKNFGRSRPAYCSVICSENLEGNSTGSRSLCLGQNLWRRILRKAMLTASSVFLPFHFLLTLPQTEQQGGYLQYGVYIVVVSLLRRKKQHSTPPHPFTL